MGTVPMRGKRKTRPVRNARCEGQALQTGPRSKGTRDVGGKVEPETLSSTQFSLRYRSPVFTAGKPNQVTGLLSRLSRTSEQNDGIAS